MAAACLMAAAVFVALIRERVSILNEVAGARDAISPRKIPAPEPVPKPHPVASPTPATAPPSAGPAPAAPLGAPAVPDKPPESTVAVPPSLGPTEWAVHGRVIDLATLQPIAGVRLRFVVAGSTALKYETISDGDGRYLAIVARDQDYDIETSRSGYASAALYEADIPYARLSVDKRRALVSEVLDGDVPRSSLSDASGRESVRRDVFLAPQR
jgi:hypothetical protein